MPSNWKNKLYYGDNLDILKSKIEGDSIDLIYLDPPFQSGKNYNIIFQPESGKYKGATAQIETFEDTWRWGEEAEESYRGLITGILTKEKANQRLINLMTSMREYLGEAPIMAYLSMMAPRLLEMRRVLKETGSIYLHCDPTASHYLKLLMDAVFGEGNFINEIVWHYRKWPSGKYTFQRNHDIILFYSRSTDTRRTFNQLFMERAPSTLKRFGEAKIVSGYDEAGHRLPSQVEDSESEGVRQDDVWDIGRVPPIKQLFPTQKPEALLERIVKASSNKGDIVLDPFCGCGTTIAVAERLNRRWIGIDITYLAIDVIAKRLEKNGFKKKVSFEIRGEPKDEYSARKLVRENPFQFQVWCIAKLGIATPSQEKTGDKGVDGFINYINPEETSRVGKGIIQVKGADKVNPSMVRDLKGTMESQNGDFAILISFSEPTQGMKTEALKSGKFKYAQKEVPKIQFLTIQDLLKDPQRVLTLPGNIMEPYKKSPIIKDDQKVLL